MNRFEKGDRVRLNQAYQQYEAGTVGVVQDVQGGLTYMLIEPKNMFERDLLCCFSYRLDPLVEDNRPLEDQIKDLLG